MSDKEIERLCIIKKIETKEITQKEAGIELGISERQVRRLLVGYRQKGGNDGIVSRHKGGNRGFTEDFKKEVIAKVRAKYSDFRPSFASEKLEEIDGLKINRETLRQLMIKEDLWKGKRRKKARIHQTRERRSRYGELIQIDGSHHDWFEGRSGKCCLLVFIDDATSKLMKLRFERSETTNGYFRVVKDYVKAYGIPYAFYSDKDSVFTVNAPSKIDGIKGVTEFARAMKELDIEIILAHSPQAKGRVERANATLQDRLIKEMRLRKIDTIEAGNKYLEEFIKEHNKKFAINDEKIVDGHREASDNILNRLDEILSFQSTRKLSKNLEMSYKNTIYQIQRHGTGYTYRGAEIVIYENTDGEIVLKKGKEVLKYKAMDKIKNQGITADSKEINKVVEAIIKGKNEAA